MSKKINFSNEVELQKLFGHEAAEDEEPTRLREYYFKSNVYDQIVCDLSLRLLVGHKGIGKSALFQVAMQEEKEKDRLTILIKPDDIAEISGDKSDFLREIRAWKKGITEIIAKKVLVSQGLMYDGWRKKLNQYGGEIIEFLVATFEEETPNLNSSKKLFVDEFLKKKKISIYIDDLDRGWEGKKNDIRRISALLNAVRDIATENRGIYFRVSLRSDVYYLVRTSDESTDKIEGSVIWHSWSNHEIFVLLIKRIESYFDRTVNESKLLKDDQNTLSRYLNPIMKPIFNGRGHWKQIPTYRILMSLIRKRPRDLVKLCTLAGRDAGENNDKIIGTENFQNIFEEYSQGRLQDTINEYRSELPDIERLLLGMKPKKINKTTKEGYIYNTEELLKKISNIMEQGSFRFSDGSIATKKDIAAFLYKINFLTARKESENGITRKYFEESRYLSSKFIDFGFSWEVHPAYRWALQPDSQWDIYKNLKLADNIK